MPDDLYRCVIKPNLQHYELRSKTWTVRLVSERDERKGDRALANWRRMGKRRRKRYWWRVARRHYPNLRLQITNFSTPCPTK